MWIDRVQLALAAIAIVSFLALMSCGVSHSETWPLEGFKPVRVNGHGTALYLGGVTQYAIPQDLEQIQAALLDEVIQDNSRLYETLSIGFVNTYRDAEAICSGATCQRFAGCYYASEQIAIVPTDYTGADTLRHELRHHLLAVGNHNHMGPGW